MTTNWILQGILATVFTASGIFTYAFHDQLKTKLSWLTAYSPSMVLFICVSKTLGGLALIVSAYFIRFAWLTTIAALGIATIMIFAMAYHIRKKEYKDLPATILFLTLALSLALNTL